MKRNKVVLATLTLALAIGCAFAVKAHKKFLIKDVYTLSGSSYVLVNCTTQSPAGGACTVPTTIQLYKRTTIAGVPTYTTIPAAQAFFTSNQ